MISTAFVVVLLSFGVTGVKVFHAKNRESRNAQSNAPIVYVLTGLYMHIGRSNDVP